MTGTTTISDNISIVRNVYTSLMGGDFDTFATLLDDNVSWRIMEGLQTTDVLVYKGRDNVMNDFLPVIPANYKELNVEPETFLADGDMVCAVGSYVGTGSTGQDFTVRFCHTYKLNNGRITDFEQIVDSAIINRAVGKILD